MVNLTTASRSPDDIDAASRHRQRQRRDDATGEGGAKAKPQISP
jgi:hypothetical protein